MNARDRDGNHALNTLRRPETSFDYYFWGHPWCGVDVFKGNRKDEAKHVKVANQALRRFYAVPFTDRLRKAKEAIEKAEPKIEIDEKLELQCGEKVLLYGVPIVKDTVPIKARVVRLTSESEEIPYVELTDINDDGKVDRVEFGNMEGIRYYLENYEQTNIHHSGETCFVNYRTDKAGEASALATFDSLLTKESKPTAQ